MTDIEPVRPPAGWYPDPTGRQRWWDGQRWGDYAPTTAYAEPMPLTSQPMMPQARPVVVHVRPLKDVGIAYILAILLGGFGAHRFYLGRIGSAIAVLIMYLIGWVLSLTVIGALLGVPLLIAVAVWLIVDLFLIPGMVRQSNARGAW